MEYEEEEEEEEDKGVWRKEGGEGGGVAMTSGDRRSYGCRH